MFAEFAKLPAWSQSLITVSFFVIILFIIKKGYIFSKTKDGWFFGINKKDIKETNIHMNCKNFDDYKNTLFNLAKLSYKLALLETKNDLVELQLDYALKKGDAMIGMLRSVYLGALSEKRGNRDDITRAKSFLLYESLLEDVIQSKIYISLRIFFKRYHLAEMSDAEYKLSREETIKDIMQKITEILDKKYIYDEEISRVELFELHCKRKHEVEKDFVEIFEQARMYAIENKIKTDEINDTIQLLLSGETVKHDYSIRQD